MILRVRFAVADLLPGTNLGRAADDSLATCSAYSASPRFKCLRFQPCGLIGRRNAPSSSTAAENLDQMNLTPRGFGSVECACYTLLKSFGGGHSSALPNDEQIDARESSSCCWAMVAFPLGPRDRGRYPKRVSVLQMLDYKRTWFTNSLRDLSALVIAPIFVAAMALTASQFQFGSRAELLCFMIPSAAIGLALFAVAARLLFWDLTFRRDFRFRVTQEFVECECPTPMLGDSFRLSFDEIREVRLEDGGSAPDRFVILDISDEEHKVSGFYGIPVFRVLHAIHDVSPTTTIVEHGRTWEAEPAVIGA